MLKGLQNMFWKKFGPSVEQIAEAELKKLGAEFYISRTGIDVLDERKETPAGLPPIFTQVYAKHRKSPDEYVALDKQSIQFREESKSIQEYRRKAQEIHYANCTMLACFMCDALLTNKIEAKLFGIGAEHHFVIAKCEEPFKLLVIDPWVGKQFKVTLNENIDKLEDLSVDSRLKICEAHLKETSLYPDYEKPIEEIKDYDTKDPVLTDQLLKQAYDVMPIERFFEPKLEKEPQKARGIS
jgi:hypothetical protein